MMKKAIIPRMQGMLRDLAFVLALGSAAVTLLPAQQAQAMSRIKDLANIEGVRENQLVGYGLVTGLTAPAETLKTSP